jgi:hypothetical protein
MNSSRTKVIAVCAVFLMAGCGSDPRATGGAVDAVVDGEGTSSVGAATAEDRAATMGKDPMRAAAERAVDVVGEDDGTGAMSGDPVDDEDEAVPDATSDDEPSPEEATAATNALVESSAASVEAEDVAAPGPDDASGRCIASAILCGVAVTGFAATCVANLFTAGTLTPECVGALNAVGGVCAEVALVCGKANGLNLPKYTIGPVGGAATSHKFSVACPGYNRANALRGKSGSQVDRVGFRCTNGALKSGGGTGGRGFDTRCPKGYLLRGVDYRSGGAVDAVRAVCARIGRPGSLAHGTWRGGSGGNRRGSLLCPANRWVYAVTGSFGANVSEFRFRCQ